MHELLGALVRGGERDYVQRRQPRLPAAADEHQCRLQRRVRLREQIILVLDMTGDMLRRGLPCCQKCPHLR